MTLSVLEARAKVEIGIVVEMDQAIGLRVIHILGIELVMLVTVPPSGVQSATPCAIARMRVRSEP